MYHPHLNFWSQIWTLDCFSVTVSVFPTHIKWFSDKGIAHISGASVKLWNTPSMAGQLFLLQSSSRSEKSKDWDKILNTLMVCGRYLIKMDTVLLMEKRHDKWKWPVAKHCITCNSIYTKCPEEANSQRENEICVGGAVFFFRFFHQVFGKSKRMFWLTQWMVVTGAQLCEHTKTHCTPHGKSELYGTWIILQKSCY